MSTQRTMVPSGRRYRGSRGAQPAKIKLKRFCYDDDDDDLSTSLSPEVSVSFATRVRAERS